MVTQVSNERIGFRVVAARLLSLFQLSTETLLRELCCLRTDDLAGYGGPPIQIDTTNGLAYNEGFNSGNEQMAILQFDGA
eukprot:SAG31_NODE_22175_length_532_cov_0.833718_2_plen_79_part_01